MTLAAYQINFNGLTIGDGTPYDITAVTGLDALPTVNVNDLDRLRDQGQYIGAHYMTGRDVLIDMEITDTTDSLDATFRALVEALTLATVPGITTELPLAFLLPGMAQVSRQVNARVINRDLPLDYPYTRHFATCKLELWATDPRIYDSTLQTAVATLPAGNGGVTWPATWPVSWGSVSSGGTVVATNSGSFESRPQITLTGPVDNPTVTNITTGLSGTLQGLTIAAGDTVVIDMNAKTILYFVGGAGVGANRRGYWTNTSTWWALVPGANTLQYGANTASVGSTMTVAYRSAWV